MVYPDWLLEKNYSEYYSKKGIDEVDGSREAKQDKIVDVNKEEGDAIKLKKD